MSRSEYISYLQTLRSGFSADVFSGVSLSSHLGVNRLNDLCWLRTVAQSMGLPDELVSGLMGLFKETSVVATPVREAVVAEPSGLLDCSDVFNSLPFASEFMQEDLGVFNAGIDDLFGSLDDFDDLLAADLEEGAVDSVPEFELKSAALLDMVAPRTSVEYAPIAWLSDGGLDDSSSSSWLSDFVDVTVPEVRVKPVVLSDIELASDLSGKLASLQEKSALVVDTELSKLERLNSLATSSERLVSTEGVDALDDGLMKFFLRTGVRVASAFKGKSSGYFEGGALVDEPEDSDEILPDPVVPAFEETRSVGSSSGTCGYVFDMSKVSSGGLAPVDTSVDAVSLDEVELSLVDSFRSVGELFSRGVKRLSDETAVLREQDLQDDDNCIRGIRQVLNRD